MSTKKNKSMVSQALLEMDEITSAIKEESKKSLKNLLSEAVRDALRESCEEEEKDYEIEDDEQNDTQDNIEDSGNSDDSSAEGDVSAEPADENPEMEPVGDETGSEMDAQEAPENGESDDEWNDFSKYQVGDDTYDLTGENDYESVVKVYKLLKDEDQVIVKKDGDKIQLKDDSVGTEYVIDLGGDDNGEAPEVEGGEENFDSLQEGIMDGDEFDPRRQEWWKSSENDASVMPSNDDEGIAGFSDEEPVSPEIEPSNSEISRASRGLEFSPDDLDINNLLDDEDDYFGDDSIYESKMNNKNKKARKPMKESKEVLFEVDLGYTDNYQDKDPIAGLSNNEPSKSGKSWHKGVPTGTNKPWAGETKSKGEPFEKTVNEEEAPEVDDTVEEATNVGGAVQQRTTPKSNIPTGRKNYGPMSKKHVSSAANYEEMVSENKKLKAENKALKETLLALKGNLNEAYVTNVNLGKITKLFLENTTSQAEKVDIVNRFSNEAKTVEQSNALYESIKRELNKDAAVKVNINESMSVANNNTINESVYKSNDVLKTIDLMNRVLKC